LASFCEFSIDPFQNSQFFWRNGIVVDCDSLENCFGLKV
jgi:hypothetical protein